MSEKTDLDNIERAAIEEAMLDMSPADGKDVAIMPELDIAVLKRGPKEDFDVWLARMDTMARNVYADGLGGKGDFKTQKAMADAIFEMTGRKRGKNATDAPNQNLFVFSDAAVERLTSAAKGLTEGMRDVTPLLDGGS